MAAAPSPALLAPQVIGTLPWVVNPPGVTASAVPTTLPAPSLQVQTVTPQLLLNAQGQVIATLAPGAGPAPAGKKTGTPEPPAKNEVSTETPRCWCPCHTAKGLAVSPPCGKRAGNVTTV